MSPQKYSELREKMSPEAKEEVRHRTNKIITGDPRMVLQIVLDTLNGAYSAAGVYFVTESTVKLIRNALAKGE